MGLATRRENPAKLKALFGRRVAELRRAKGWTQEKMAERLGTSVQWLSRIEGGGENVTIDTLVLFANTLSVTVVELLTPAASDARVPVATKRGRPRKPS